MFGNNTFKIISTVGGVGAILIINYIIYNKTLKQKLTHIPSQTNVATKNQATQCEYDITEFTDSGDLEIIALPPVSWLSLKRIGL